MPVPGRLSIIGGEMKIQPKQFTRLVTQEYFMSLIKEARRVKYIVKGKARDFYEVRDDETNDLVFRGIFQGRFWIATFSTLYWQVPA